ncbi:MULTISPECIES: Cas9 inhibitor AcrIIA9 family protein [unclassified Bilifractor]|uniref:Cas9 inhibitor AcrIIA9 family protein n=1 Tax=unclassified Bilifractor TaxID=2815795 RepID=UPI003F8FD98C
MSEVLDKALKKLDQKVSDRVFKASDFFYPVRDYLKKRAEEDESMAEDILDEKKTMDECCTYIFRRARHQLPINASEGWIKNETIYEWSEDYWRATEEDVKKVIVGSVKSKKSKPKANPSKTVADPTEDPKKADTPKTAQENKADPVAKSEPKPKKKSKKKGELEGQMSLFDFIS